MIESNDKTDYFLEENMQKVQNKIIIMSGKGGVGKSTVSVNLAYSLALQGKSVGILDVDIHGPSIAKMTGIESKKFEIQEDKRIKPIKSVNNVFVFSIALMLEDPTKPIIWRGPAKTGAIKQFLSEINWPILDYMIIDCPPGTGDEPLSIMQLIQNLNGTIIVTTPQDVALIDVQKSINFSKALNIPVLGIIENMSGFICPKCGEMINIFKTGGAKKLSKQFDIELLGIVPIDTNIVESTDNGKPYVYHYNKLEGAKKFDTIANKIMKKVEKLNNMNEEKKTTNTNNSTIAIPIFNNNMMSTHFGHPDKFVVINIKDKNIISETKYDPPKHEPGVLPKWMNEMNVTTLIVNGIGQNAVNLLKSYNISIIRGVPLVNYKEIVKQYINNELEDKEVLCKYDH